MAHKADNTVREAKNSYLMTFLNALVGKFFLRSATLAHLRKSHTHCRIGLVKMKTGRDWVFGK